MPSNTVDACEPVCLDMSPVFDDTIRALERQLKKLTCKLVPRDLTQLVLDDVRGAGSGGEERLAKIRDTLAYFDTHGHLRSNAQVNIHEVYLRASIRNIYTTDYEDNIEKIMRDNNWTEMEMRQQVLIGTPRRFGKTYSTAMFAAAMFVNVPNVKICIYSTGKETAQAMLELIKELFYVLPQSGAFVEYKNNEAKFIFTNALDPKDKRSIKSFTSNEKVHSCVRVCVCVCGAHIDTSVCVRL